jgi:release factor glutamine methyltransferase
MNHFFYRWVEALELTGLTSPAREVRLMISAITGRSYESVYLELPDLVPDQIGTIEDFIRRRTQGEPLSKILGQREFFGRTFIINSDVLDPRPDSETLITAVLESVKVPNPSILELGVGSGCLIITLMLEIKGAWGLGIDISPKALTVAQTNTQNLGLSDSLHLINSDWFSSVSGVFDVIISNPPYIGLNETLEPNVKNYDPALALYGGDDGLEAYKAILRDIKKHIHSQSQIFFEIGYTQKNEVIHLASVHGLTLARAYNDLAGIPRILEFRLNS